MALRRKKRKGRKGRVAIRTKASLERKDSLSDTTRNIKGRTPADVCVTFKVKIKRK